MADNANHKAHMLISHWNFINTTNSYLINFTIFIFDAKSLSNFLKGKNSKSIKFLNKLIQNDKSNPYFRELLAEIYFSSQNYEKAIKYQNEAIKLSSSSMLFIGSDCSCARL